MNINYASSWRRAKFKGDWMAGRGSRRVSNYITWRAEGGPLPMTFGDRGRLEIFRVVNHTFNSRKLITAVQLVAIVSGASGAKAIVLT
jgi:hypothetical protein